MRTRDLRDRWNELHGQNGYLQRLDPNHPLDFFIGVSQKGYDELALFTTIEPAKLTSSKALEVEKGIRRDSRWATQIYSIKHENQDIFAKFCLDLVECSRNCQSEAEGLSSVTRRYLAWQKLFARLKETLSTTVLKGLIGELDFARVLISHGYSKDDVIASWCGPNGADRDFVLPQAWYENKAISTGKSKVSISSLNQLETENEGYLTVIYVDEAASTDPNAFSVQKYIDEFRSLLSDSPDAVQVFEQKLVSIGYIDKTVYENIFFVKGNREYYRVEETFPRLITKNVSPCIVAVQYDLSISGIQPWKVKEEEVWN